MIGNLSKVENRLKTYFAAPDRRFNVKSGLTPSEEAVKSKVRQFWADKDVSGLKKLEGLNIDLSGFDPRKTSSKQLREIGAILADRGIIDGDLVGVMSSINVKYDATGREIEMDREVNAYRFFDEQLTLLQGVINEGNEIAKGAMVELKTSISIIMALEEYAKTPRQRSLVNIRV
ncbi:MULTISPECIES: hypothetical protein [unclassified Pseudomonas]|uniref:hypothetical protein n=1 Tax=unclassified Pseudomonas TaxID=196821 RepID=UPI000D393A25|nr:MULTISPECIES: hypothetical protein [unclassified Pseudomonas]RAU43601.1 hypothetical protein DBP26_018890 [Pseudomonas sp. RIT 409]RAU54467.1 hypothetical protein DBY65_009080 [Pseudomonas sp. RIT 412]